MAKNEILIDGVIGKGKDEVSASDVKRLLASCDKSKLLTVRIHSEGGSVFEGFAIHDAFKAWDGPKKAVIESSAFSISSFIPMAFDEIEITPNGYLMLHNPSVETGGDDEDLAKESAALAKFKQNMISAYAQRSGKSEEEVASILKQETYYNANEALQHGFVTRITAKAKIGRVFAKVNSMPHGVVAALFGAGSGGNNNKSTKGATLMSDSTPVAATVQEIKKAFPKAKSDFIVRCIEQALPMASVASVAAEELMQENDDLQTKCKAMEEEIAKLKAAAGSSGTASTTAEGEGTEVQVTETEPEEGGMEAKAKSAVAKRTGANPVAAKRSPGGNSQSATARWNEELDKAVAACKGDRHKALIQTNRKHPELRVAMLEEVNSGRRGVASAR